MSEYAVVRSLREIRFLLLVLITIEAVTAYGLSVGLGVTLAALVVLTFG